MDSLLSNEQQQRNHAVLITSLTLITEIVRIKTDELPNAPTIDLNNDYMDEQDKKSYITKRYGFFLKCLHYRKYVLHFRKYIPVLLKILRGLLMSPYALEHDVGGVADPFLQVKILRLLRILGKGSTKASEAMNDVLAQVATNTDSPKNAGNAVLYECVRTIMDIESEKGLRVLGINQLSKFLVNRDNNLRYVALQMLAKVALKDAKDVNRHLNTIVECLKDPDISIRRRALDLIFVLVNEDNIRFLASEMMVYLQNTGSEDNFKEQLTTKICTLVEKFAPSKEWKIDTLLKLIILSGQFVREEIATVFIGLVTQTPELQGVIGIKLYNTLKKIAHKPHILMKQEVLLQVGVWCIGEYADLMLQHEPTEGGEELTPITQEEIVTLLFDLMHTIPHGTMVVDMMNSGNATVANSEASDTAGEGITSGTGHWGVSHDITRAFVLMALVKLSNHVISNKPLWGKIEEFLLESQADMELEIQQRSCEYHSLLTKVKANIRAEALDRMPPIEIEHVVQALVDKAGHHTHAPALNTGTSSRKEEAKPQEKPKPVPKETNFLEELLLPSTGSGEITTIKPITNSLLNFFEEENGDMVDIPKVTPTTRAEPSSLFEFLDSPALPMTTFPSISASVNAPVVNQGVRKVDVFNKGGISIRMDCKVLDAENHPDVTNIITYFVNSNGFEVTELDFLIAVPKYITLQIFKSSSDTIPPQSEGKVTQKLKLTNTQHGQKALAVKFKLKYKNGQTQEVVEEQGTIKL
jgi:AP-1 complex subunit gamma-1